MLTLLVIINPTTCFVWPDFNRYFVAQNMEKSYRLQRLVIAHIFSRPPFFVLCLNRTHVQIPVVWSAFWKCCHPQSKWQSFLGVYDTFLSETPHSFTSISPDTQFLKILDIKHIHIDMPLTFTYKHPYKWIVLLISFQCKNQKENFLKK